MKLHFLQLISVWFIVSLSFEFYYNNSRLFIFYNYFVILFCCRMLISSEMYKVRLTLTWSNKKDGYRQQNVRQRQKLISIIEYDVCMTFY